jgi:hypothetical protein
MHALQAGAPAPSMPATKELSCARGHAGTEHFWSLTDLNNVVAYVCRLSPTGSASCSLVSMIVCTVLDRGRNTRMHLSSISRPYAVRKNSRSPQGAHAQFRVALPPRRTLWTAPLGCERKIKERRKGRKPSGSCQAVAVSHPGCSDVGNWRDTSGNCGNCRNGSAGCCPQRWIPVSGDQRFGLQCFFVQCFQGLGVAQGIILRAGARCHRTVISS